MVISNLPLAQRNPSDPIARETRPAHAGYVVAGSRHDGRIFWATTTLAAADLSDDDDDGATKGARAGSTRPSDEGS